jgi:hypothetical protein
MLQHYIEAEIVSVQGKRRIPRTIMKKIVETIESMLQFHESGLVHGGAEGALIRFNGLYAATIKTRFHYSKKKHGILFHTCVLVHKVVRRVARYRYHAKVAVDTLKATLVIRPTIGKLALN